MSASDTTSAAPADERDLIRRARSGSLPAYDEVMRRYERRVFGLLLRRCPSRHDAEDLVQETFLRAWQRLHLYDDRWPFSTWILTIAARLATTQHRRGRREHAGERVADLAGAALEEAERREAREEGRRIWRLADRVLSEEQRMAMWLRYADDMPVKNIARILGKTAVATRVLLFRARAALAAHAPDDRRADADMEGAAARAEPPVVRPAGARRSHASLDLAAVSGAS